MKKSKLFILSILAILLTIYNVIIFVIPVEKTVSFWLSYTFTSISFILQLFVLYVAFKKATTLRSKFLGFPIVYIGITYLAVQVAVGFLFVLLPIIPSWIAVIVMVLLLGVATICLITTEASKDEILRIENKVAAKRFYIDSLTVDVELIINKTADSELKKHLSKLVDIIRYSDPMSNEQLRYLEDTIAKKIIELKNQVISSDVDNAQLTTNELIQLFEERNKKCKIMK